jgi:peptidoglycan biosynthesis protein MviN/MurJ (putative lipid II flippase)
MTARTRRSEASGAHVAGVVVATPFLLAFHGWALKTAWNWFVVPILGGPRLGIAQAIGLSVVLAVARPRRSDDKDETPREVWVRMVSGVLTVLLTLGIGWIVHEVMA